jgi:hypothetical protein
MVVLRLKKAIFRNDSESTPAHRIAGGIPKPDRSPNYIWHHPKRWEDQGTEGVLQMTVKKTKTIGATVVREAFEEHSYGMFRPWRFHAGSD